MRKVAVLSFFLVMTPVLAQLATSPWPKYQNDTRNSGKSNRLGPETPQIKWSTPIQNWVSGSLALAPNGTIYFAGDNRLISLSPSGESNWTYHSTDNPAGIAVRSDGRLIVSGVGLYCFSPSGSIIWNVERGFGSVFPSIGPEGTIYSTRGSELYALDPDGRRKWGYGLGTLASGFSPALSRDGQTLYVGGQDGSLLAIRSSNGEPRWRYAPEGQLGISSGAPVVAPDGRVLWGTTRGTGLNPQGFVNSVDSFGRLTWRYPLELSMAGSPAVDDDGTVYANSSHGLIALESNGILKWMIPWDSAFPSQVSPIIDSSGIIFIARNDRLSAIRQDGTLKWDIRLPGSVESPIILGDDQIIYVFAGNAIVAVGHRDNEAPVAIAKASQMEAVEGTAVILDGTGSYDPEGDDIEFFWHQVTGPPVVIEDADSAMATIELPPVTQDQNLKFELQVTDGSLSSSDSVDVIVRNAMFFAQYADASLGGTRGFRTILFLTGSSTSQTAEIRFFESAGESSQIPIAGQLSDRHTVSMVEISSRAIVTDGTSVRPHVGWLKILSPRQISGSAVFQYFEGSGIPFTEAGVGESEYAKVFIAHITKDEAGLLNTGVAVANFHDEDLTISVLISDLESRVVVDTSIWLPPRGHTAQFVDELEPSLEGESFEGTLVLRAERNFVGTLLRTKQGYPLSSLPLSPLR
jgi:outer membrane protein assembly factor BamB